MLITFTDEQLERIKKIIPEKSKHESNDHHHGRNSAIEEMRKAFKELDEENEIDKELEMRLVRLPRKYRPFVQALIDSFLEADKDK